MDLATKEAKAREEADDEGRAARPRGLRQPRQPRLPRGAGRQRRPGRGPVARLPARAARLGVALRRAALQRRSPDLDLGGSVNALAFSPDGTWVVSGAGVQIIAVRRRRGRRVARRRVGCGAGRRRKTLLRGKGSVYSVAVSPDGKHRRRGGVRFAQERRPRLGLGCRDGADPLVRGRTELKAMSVAFSPDGKSLAVGYGDYIGQHRDVRQSRSGTWPVGNGQRSPVRGGRERGRLPSRRKAARRRRLGSRGGLGRRRRRQASRLRGTRNGSMASPSAPTANGWPPAAGTGPSSSGTPPPARSG